MGGLCYAYEYSFLKINRGAEMFIIVICIGLLLLFFLAKRKYKKGLIEIYTLNQFVNGENGMLASNSRLLDKVFKDVFEKGKDSDSTDDTFIDTDDGDDGGE
jgi:hypothetical protein